MDKESTIQAIIDYIESADTVIYSMWTIGLTNNPKERKRQHQEDGKSTKYWEQWTADSLTDAEEVEAYFVNTRGTKSGTIGDVSSQMTVYVYVL